MLIFLAVRNMAAEICVWFCFCSLVNVKAAEQSPKHIVHQHLDNGTNLKKSQSSVLHTIYDDQQTL